jgi:hypothetical protein
MKFLISIPCQLIVVIFIAVTISSVVSVPLEPLTGALSINNTAEPATAVSQPQTAAPFKFRPIIVALLVALGTFFLWHVNRYYRSESAIRLAKRSGARVTSTDGLTGLMRYLFSDVKINFADRNISAKALRNLQQIHNLTSLNLASCRLNEKSLMSLVYCRFLKEVDVSGNGLSRDALLKFRRKTTAQMLHNSIV